MPSLKDLRIRIRSVQSTQKITAAMKVVAASRLRRAQEQAEAARPYAQRMERVLASLAARMTGLPTAPPLLVGTGKDETHLIVVATSDRGLGGGVPTPTPPYTPLQRLDPARSAAPHPRDRSRRQAGDDPDRRAQGA
jgi:F-type H+-transporting ATPase subunit gamma